MTLDGLRIVVDCAHGAGYKSTPCVLRELGAETIVYGNQPDGLNINKDCGSMHPEQLSHMVRESKADIGIAHDGDADRVLLCDERGELMDGDDILAILGLEQLASKALPKNTIVGTVMTNAGLDVALKNAGGHIVRTPVGDQHVIAEMLKNDYFVGGEQSGHIIFREFSTTGDGLMAALQILRVMKKSGKKLSELARCWTRYPQILTNIKVRERKPIEEMSEVLTLISKAEADLKSQGGRVLLRYSGTEPKIRLLLEGRERAVLEHWNERIGCEIQKSLGN
jgi:phosphoglucosamine mutase